MKLNSDGTVERFKARLVARGFTQVYGMDYTETFSPVVKHGLIRLLLAFAVSTDMFMQQFDIKTAFLYGQLEEEIYMQQPPGYVKNSNLVCRLKGSLYGLKQAPRCFNNKFVEVLKKFDMQSSDADTCVFIKSSNQNKLILAIYVDDGLVLSNNNQLTKQLLNHLEENFEIKICKFTKFLGFQIERVDGNIFLHQKQYILKILQKFNMENCNSVSTPIDRSIYTTLVEYKIVDDKFPYRELIGSLLYLSILTRPDISYAVGVLSKYLDKPNVVHINSA